MKWRKIVKPVTARIRPAPGDLRLRTGFAFFPCTDEYGVTFWLERYTRIQEWRVWHELAPDLPGIAFPVEGWVTVEVEHLCTFPRNPHGGYAAFGSCLYCGREREVRVSPDVPRTRARATL